MKKLFSIVLALTLVFSLAACGSPSDDEEGAEGRESTSAPEVPAGDVKTPLSVAELVEGTYTGTLSGDSYTSHENDTYDISPEISPAEITLTIRNGQAELYSAASVTASGAVMGVEAPDSPAYTQIVSGKLPLSQADKSTVSAAGEIAATGEKPWIYWDGDMKFTGWEIKPIEDETYRCSVLITVSNGVPTAEITVDGSKSHRTATVPLVLKSEAVGELLSAPYVQMLKDGDYKYTYPLTYENKPYTATIAAYNGMVCRRVVSDDGAYNARVVTINGNAWEVNELSGAVVDLGAEGAETLPDYAATLTFAGSKTLDTGAIGEAYDFEYDGVKCNMVFVFSPEKELVELIMTVGEETSEMEILSFSAAGNDRTLFDAPQQ